MKKSLALDALERALTASAALVEEDNRVFVVVGASAVLAVADKLAITEELLATQDVDLFPQKVEQIPNMDEFDAALGEGSPFHIDNGFYIERVGSWTLLDQPAGWIDRAKVVQGPNFKAYCIGLSDLAINKLHVARPKDITFVREMLRQKLVLPADILAILQNERCQDHVKESVCGRLEDIQRAGFGGRD